MWPVFAAVGDVLKYLQDTLHPLITGKSSQTSVNTVSTNVGSNADAASSTGSGHAKLKELRARVVERNPVDWASKTLQASTITGTAQTEVHLDITGSGYLVWLWGAGGNQSYTVQIDGGIIRAMSTQNTSNVFPMRFNTRLIVRAGGVAGGQYHAGAVID